MSIAACASLESHRNHHALARRQAVGLDYNRRALLLDIIVRRVRIGESRVRGGRNAMPDHECLGEIL